MAIQPEFETINEADSAYYGSSTSGGFDTTTFGTTTGGDGSGGGSGGDGSGGDGSGSNNWGQIQAARGLPGGWTLAYQKHVADDKRRWFVIGTTSDGTLKAINSQGNVETRQTGQPLGQLPHYSLKDDALTAYNRWAEANNEDTVNTDGDGSNSGGSTEWGKWKKLRQVDPWWIFHRTAKKSDKVQFCAASKRNGNAVYLQPDGTISPSIHIYSSVDDLSAALEAYNQKKQDGEITNPPNGEAPSTNTIKKASSKVHTATKQSKLVEKLAGKKALVGAVAVGGLAVLKMGGSSAGGSN